MDELISNADFLHDDLHKYSKFHDKISEWRRENAEIVTSTQILSAIDSLNKKLMEGKCPTYGTEGWRQVKIVYNDLIYIFISDLIDDGKLNAGTVGDAYFNMYLEWFHYGPATIHLEIINETFHAGEVNMKKYIQTLNGEPRTKLFKAITSPIEKKENTKNKVFYRKRRRYMDRFVGNAFGSSSLLEKDTMRIWLDYSFHLYLDYLHLDDKSLGYVCGEAGDRFDEISDGWEKFIDMKAHKSFFEKVKTATKECTFLRGEKAAKAVAEPISILCKKLRKCDDFEPFMDDVFDLLEAVSTCHGDLEHVIYLFQEVLRFFNQQENYKRGQVKYFKAVASRYRILIEKLDMKFLEGTIYCNVIMDRLEETFSNEEILVEDWVALITPLLQRPCYNTIQAARTVLICGDVIKWKDHRKEAKKVFQCLIQVPIPTEDGQIAQEYIKDFASCVKCLLQGLGRAMVLKEFGQEMLMWCLDLLELKVFNNRIYDLVDEIGKCIKIEFKENKDKVLEAMKRLHVILKMDDLPWSESWPLQRAVEDIVSNIINGSSNNGCILADSDLKVLISICDTCLTKDPLNPMDSSLSVHYCIAKILMIILMRWRQQSRHKLLEEPAFEKLVNKMKHRPKPLRVKPKSNDGEKLTIEEEQSAAIERKDNPSVGKSTDNNSKESSRPKSHTKQEIVKSVPSRKPSANSCNPPTAPKSKPPKSKTCSIL